MIEPDIGEDKEVEASGGVALIDQVNLVCGGGMADMGEATGGPGAVLGVGENGHHLIETAVHPPVSDVHFRISAKEFSDLGKPSRITVGVIARHQISD